MTWTDRDVKKRNIAKQNHLNYLEIFSTDIDVCVEQIKTKISELHKILKQEYKE